MKKMIFNAYNGTTKIFYDFIEFELEVCPLGTIFYEITKFDLFTSNISKLVVYIIDGISCKCIGELILCN